jgi:uncharacterized protein
MTENDPAILLARAAKLKLFVMLRRVLKPELLAKNLGAHLRWLIAREKEGVVFMSGPVAPRDGVTTLSGLTLIRARTIEEAETLAQNDPFIKLGIFAFEMREWTVNEGGFSLFVSLSDSSVAFRE